MKPEPKSIELLPAGGVIEIEWTDGVKTCHSMDELRRLCPCATCRDEREKLKSSGPTLRVIEGPVVSKAVVIEYRPVGRYALAFTWNDGHSAGIYTYDFLRKHTIQRSSCDNAV